MFLRAVFYSESTEKCDPNWQRNLSFPHKSQWPLWSDNRDDEEVISGNKPPGLCDQDVQMSDSSHELIIETHTVS